MTANVPLLRDAGPLDTDGGDGGFGETCKAAVKMAFGNPDEIERCELVAVDGGELVHVVYKPYCLGGRRPSGLAPSHEDVAGDAVANWLACTARLEAASVDAFHILANELSAHGAPRLLVSAARAAASDERRHARLVGRLARERGARPLPAFVRRQPERTLEEIARENVVEGCVRETFAALVAWRQARTAAEPAIRATMAALAQDETRHAALSWAVHAWSSERLAAPARRRLNEARDAASAALEREVAESTPSADTRAQAGLPGPDEAQALVTTLRDRLG